jgi:hypothetical protein
LRAMFFYISDKEVRFSKNVDKEREVYLILNYQGCSIIRGSYIVHRCREFNENKTAEVIYTR